MDRQQIAAEYDSFPPEQRNISREEFIKRYMNATDLNKMITDADAIVQGRIQKAKIDASLRMGR